jgi:hypothetical protein
MHSSSLQWQGQYFDNEKRIEWRLAAIIGRNAVLLSPGYADTHPVSRPVPQWVPSFFTIRTIMHIPSDAAMGEYSVYCYGLPNPSMYTIEDHYPGNRSFVGGGFWIKTAQSAWYFPARIVPARFALSSAFWACVIGSLWASVAVLRRRRRRARGECVQCAYSLHGLPASTTVCPECGTAISTPVAHA